MARPQIEFVRAGRACKASIKKAKSAASA